MIKFIFMLMFMMLMLVYNKKVMFYYNICFLMSFMYLFKYLFKDLIWISVGFYSKFDFYSYFLILLSMWIMGLVFMVIQLEVTNLKMIIFMMMLIILVFLFSVSNLLLFYLMFEVSLIPTFIMIIYWGNNFERLKASFYLLMYTMFISLPLLIYLMKLFKISMTYEIDLLKMNNFIYLSFFDYLMMFMAFLIKMPIYIFHIWLPKAHVEAPVYGSMILASILLKLGSYGLLRFLEIFYMKSLEMSFMIFSVGIVGSLLVSLICLVQIDMKSLVAYSSVVHMNMMLCSLYTMTKLGFMSAYILMVSHGLCSSGLFFMVNLYYERSMSRLMFFNKGMMMIHPSLSMWWMFYCAMNFSFPLSLNFISEIYMISVIISWDIMMMIYLMMICFFSSAYSLYLYSYIQHGGYYIESKKVQIIYMKDYLILILHFIPLFFIIFNLSMLY
uniref:NADH-ubiquinone oxidoreductase chain 4 n=1 Tax=Polyrhachis dives TaxID=84555 RepID=A0A1B0UTU9_9HYME|nr:NADH dehydrogenase subunit 4 [Polyrhachis dives]AMJ17073.1 NADH dehydrogenase subunit 4 [Polyrhachis dives]AUT77308.1 NADH dehydrogenase subunit 4 [Polyrhachis dives]